MDRTFSENSILTYLSMRLQASLHELVEHTAMPTSTVVGILSRLSKEGLVKKGGTVPAGRGRPTVMYHLRLPNPVIVCQLDGTRLMGGVLENDLSFRAREVHDVGPIATRERALALLRKLIASLEKRTGISRRRVAGFALSINMIQADDSQLRSSVLPWVADDIPQFFSSGLRIPVRLVHLPTVLAEYQTFTTQVPRSLILFRVGDGVSAHAVLASRVYRGGAALAGELGHVVVDPNGPLCGCGRRGCVEAFCSGPGIYRRVLEELRSGVFSALNSAAFDGCQPRQAMAEIENAWSAGDDYARGLMESVFDRLGWALGLVMNLMDPDYVAMGGYLLADRPDWVDEIVRRSRRWTVHAALRKTRFAVSRITTDDELRVIGTQFYYQPENQQ